MHNNNNLQRKSLVTRGRKNLLSRRDSSASPQNDTYAFRCRYESPSAEWTLSEAEVLRAGSDPECNEWERMTKKAVILNHEVAKNLKARDSSSSAESKLLRMTVGCLMQTPQNDGFWNFRNVLISFFLSLTLLASIPSFAESNPMDGLGLTMDECIEIAVVNSKEIKISSEKIILTKIKRVVTFRDLFPSLSVSWDDVKGSGGSEINPAYKGTKYGVEMEQEIWPREFPDYTHKQSEKNLKFNEIDYEKVNKDLIYEVQKSFYEFAMAKKELKDQKDIQEKTSALFALAGKEEERGLISQLEYLKSLSKRKEIENQIKAKEYIVKLAAVKLRNVLRLDDYILPIDINEGGLFTTADKKALLLKEENDDNSLLDGYVNMALINRLEAKMQKTKVEFYEYGDKAVRGKEKPKLSLIGSFKKTGDAFGFDRIECENEWFIGAKVAFPWLGNTFEGSYQTGVDVPNRTSTYSTINESDVRNRSAKIGVLNNLQYYYERKESNIAYQSALKEEDDQKRKIIEEVSESFYKYKNAISKASAADERLKFAFKQEEIVETLRKSAEETISRSLEVLSELQEAKNFFNETLFEYYVSVLDLNKAVGKEFLFIRRQGKKGYYVIPQTGQGS